MISIVNVWSRVLQFLMFRMTCDCLWSCWRTTKVFLWWARVISAVFRTTLWLHRALHCHHPCCASCHQRWDWMCSAKALPAACLWWPASLRLTPFRCVNMYFSTLLPLLVFANWPVFWWSLQDMWGPQRSTIEKPLEIADARFTGRMAPCGLRGCKNWPTPFPGRMSYKATKPSLALSVVYLSMFIVLLFMRAPFYVLLVFVLCVLSFGCSG